jgi:hypothetical protein
LDNLPNAIKYENGNNGLFETRPICSQTQTFATTNFTPSLNCCGMTAISPFTVQRYYLALCFLFSTQESYCPWHLVDINFLKTTGFAHIHWIFFVILENFWQLWLSISFFFFFLDQKMPFIESPSTLGSSQTLLVGL